MQLAREPDHRRDLLRLSEAPGGHIELDLAAAGLFGRKQTIEDLCHIDPPWRDAVEGDTVTATCIDKVHDQLVIAALAGVAAFLRLSAIELGILLPSAALSRWASATVSWRRSATRNDARET